jgi:MFS family permease
VDAAVAVALANTLFFAAATAESRTNVALYLAITVAPFALVAPVIGPLLDRLQRGRRTALAVSFGGRAVLAVVMAFGYDSWVLYPAALGVMVLSKSFVVLKAAVTPRVLPEAITLVTTNSRLTTFGLASGAVFGGLAAGVAAVWGSRVPCSSRHCWRWRVWCCACGSRPGSRSPRARCRPPCTNRKARRRPQEHPTGRPREAANAPRWGARRSWRCGATAPPAC